MIKKFRVWDSDKKEMLYLDGGNRTLRMYSDSSGFLNDIVNRRCVNHVSFWAEQLMQWVFMVDIDRVDIYEKDILDLTTLFKSDTKVYGHVELTIFGVTVVILDKYGNHVLNTYLAEHWGAENYIKIIGNTYEMPDYYKNNGDK